MDADVAAAASGNGDDGTSLPHGFGQRSAKAGGGSAAAAAGGAAMTTNIQMRELSRK